MMTGLNMGVYGLWSGVLTEVLPSTWSDSEKGMFGLVNTVCSVVGGLVSARGCSVIESVLVQQRATPRKTADARIAILPPARATGRMCSPAP